MSIGLNIGIILFYMFWIIDLIGKGFNDISTDHQWRLFSPTIETHDNNPFCGAERLAKMIEANYKKAEFKGDMYA